MGHMREGRSSKCSKFIRDYFWNFKESLKVFKKVSKSCFQNFSHTWYHTCLCRIFVIHGEHKFLGNFQNFKESLKVFQVFKISFSSHMGSYGEEGPPNVHTSFKNIFGTSKKV